MPSECRSGNPLCINYFNCSFDGEKQQNLIFHCNVTQRTKRLRRHQGQLGITFCRRAESANEVRFYRGNVVSYAIGDGQLWEFEQMGRKTPSTNPVLRTKIRLYFPIITSLVLISWKHINPAANKTIAAKLLKSLEHQSISEKNIQRLLHIFGTNTN